MQAVEENELSFDEGSEDDMQIAPNDKRIHTSSGDLEVE